MSIGSTAYQIYTSGSNATSAGLPGPLFGLYNGLSTINQADVVHIMLNSSGLECRIGSTDALTSNNLGILVSAAGSTFDLPPMRAADASGLKLARVTSDNASVTWTIWRRLDSVST